VAETTEELRRLSEDGTPRDRLIWTAYFFSHFFSQPEERLAFRRALIAAGFTGVGSDEELTGDEFWHHYSHTIRLADPSTLLTADAEAAAISQAHGVQYDGWEIVRVHGTGALRGHKGRHSRPPSDERGRRLSERALSVLRNTHMECGLSSVQG
jgi:hypothetical protein